jgi:KDO2-lipid IV(A) lauroyltransferase
MGQGQKSSVRIGYRKRVQMLNDIKYYSIRAAIISRTLCGHATYQQGARIVAWISYVLLRQKRNVLAENLRHMSRTENHLARETLINFGLAYADFLAVRSMNSKKISEMVEVHGLSNLDRALSAGKGVVFVSAHLGNPNLEACYIAGLGYKIVGVTESLGPEERLFDLYSKLRGKTGMEIVRLEDREVGIKAVKALRRNKVLMLLGDRDITGNGVKVDFLGQESLLPRGPALLSLKTGAPIVTAFFVSDNRKYKFVTEPPIEFRKSGILEKDVQDLTQLIASRLERNILAYPTQWYVFQMDWKNT